MNNMNSVTLGRTGLEVTKNSFGCLPIQRVSEEYAVMLMRKACDAGINFYDTARGYTDSEEKVGVAFEGIRENIIIATKTPAKNANGFWEDLETSLSLLKTDYVDILQFHNPAFVPRPGDENGLYDAILQAQRQGKVRHIGITNHRPAVAKEAILSGLYDTLQFPFNYLATDTDLELIELCKQNDVGFISMKGLSGGLITNSAAACAYQDKFDNVVTIWGVQKENELDEFIAHQKNPPVMDDTLQTIIENDRADLMGEFCRACGYCLPCPVGIEINTAARMMYLLRRSPSARLLSEESKQMMSKVADCIECGQCKSKCPYGLDTPTLLKKHYKDYLEVIAGKPLSEADFLNRT